jgi:hypothetical protein
MTAELGRGCGSAEDVLALKQAISACTLASERLREALAVNRRRSELLASLRCARAR